MTGRALSELKLPQALAELLRAIYGDGESARRAAVAPWPELRFRSAAQERALFHDSANKKDPRRLRLESLLRAEKERFSVDKPFFVCEGTTGQLRSPDPVLTDAEFWCFVWLWEDEAEARRQLESEYGVLGGQSGIEYVRRYRRRGLRAWIDRLLSGPSGGIDPVEEVFTWHARNRSGVYV